MYINVKFQPDINNYMEVIVNFNSNTLSFRKTAKIAKKFQTNAINDIHNISLIVYCKKLMLKASRHDQLMACIYSNDGNRLEHIYRSPK